MNHRGWANIPERVRFHDTWMVENHFCVGFIEPFGQSLQSNQDFQPIGLFGKEAFNDGLRIVYPVIVT